MPAHLSLRAKKSGDETIRRVSHVRIRRGYDDHNAAETRGHPLRRRGLLPSLPAAELWHASDNGARPPRRNNREPSAGHTFDYRRPDNEPAPGLVARLASSLVTRPRQTWHMEPRSHSVRTSACFFFLYLLFSNSPVPMEPLFFSHRVITLGAFYTLTASIVVHVGTFSFL